MEKKRIITIGREFGSGGRTIGKEVAQKLARKSPIGSASPAMTMS